MSEKAQRRTPTFDETNPRRRLIGLPVMALLLALLLEWANRGMSLLRLCDFILQRPLYFLFNALIVLTTLTFSEMFKRRRAVLSTTCILWLILGVVEYLVSRDRTQPFSSVDIFMLKDAFSLITIYYTWPQIILMFGSAFLVIVLVALMFTRMPFRRHFNRTASILTFVGFVFLCAMLSAVGVRSGFFPRRFEYLVDAYNDYGFATCFTLTFGQQGISKPESYSSEVVQGIVSDIDSEELPTFSEEDNLAQPNIIIVQLESFFDVNTIIGAEYSEDPTPNYNRFCRNFPSGLLFVPTVGGGTANTEFEVLTGMDVDFFGAGEYPYNTILQQEAVESAPRNLKEQGYTATALHNNTGTFYSRHLVYPNIGFDRFVPLEYMKEVKYTDLGWARDNRLTEEILQSLQTTDTRDFVMCVTVESHGKYAETYEPKEGDIQATSLPEGVPYEAFENYINVIPHTDTFLKDLIHAIARFDEPTVVVAYGDHLPALEFTADMLSTGSVYTTRYFIWNNYGKAFEAPDLQAYRLSANLFKQLGFSGGLLFKYHQSVDATEAGEEYLDKLEQLQYDILYGDKEAFEGESPYEATDMTMGSLPVTVTDVTWEYGRLIATGENFNEFSKLTVEGKPLQTTYVNSTTLVAPLEDDPPEAVSVQQISKDNHVLGSTEPVSVHR